MGCLVVPMPMSLNVFVTLLAVLAGYTLPMTGVFLRPNSDEFILGSAVEKGGSYTGRDPQKRLCHSYVLPACNDEWERCGCDKREYNVSAISRAVQFVKIGGWDRVCGGSCMLSSYLPLPHLPNLTSIWIFDVWVAPDDQPFPLGRFLVNVRRSVTEMRLAGIHLPTLTRDTFAGFAALTVLELLADRVSAISLDAFVPLMTLQGQASPSKLTRVTIAGGNFTKFDWSVFAPVGETLKTASLTRSGIEEIYLSQFSAMSAVETVSLAGNRLTRIDDSLLSSVSTPWVRPYLDLQSIVGQRCRLSLPWPA
ncbi:uncharacterized protein LOC129583106 [Paramacrobiotus metropolitanus]|uniref:uncharacterized protein LOC129583106 n=1 Tax=Paramacrobiotus metropolitanus TaxID=2943436 RepID=UPI00244572C5|nr:uncharacterized protein LOC129583106 [Paramacrobiotus metropolitanus]